MLVSSFSQLLIISSVLIIKTLHAFVLMVIFYHIYYVIFFERGSFVLDVGHSSSNSI